MKLFYRKYGTGPCIVILHGLYGSSDNWVTIARKLSDKFTVILPDMRNHGQSPHSQDHTYDLMAEDIVELTQELNIGRFILAGHSMGGRVAMNFALKFPGMLEALIVIDISPIGSTDPENLFFKQHKVILESILSLDIRGLKSRTDVENFLALRIESERTRGFLMKNLTRNSEGLFEWKLNAESLLLNLTNITGSIINENMYQNPVSGFPVYFIRGEKSDYINPDDFPIIRSLFPAAELVTIKDAGHWIHADQPDEIEKLFLSLI
jgi:pimeloyl-ACP methyl ester carboxylesterase